MLSKRSSVPALVVGLALLLSSGLSHAQSMPGMAGGTTAGAEQPVRGLWLTSDFPELTERIGDAYKIDFSLENAGLAPQRVELSVDGLPDGWSYEIRGDNRPVTAAMVGRDANRRLTLSLTPPKDVAEGTYRFTVHGKGEGETLSLPVTLKLAAAEPAQLTLDPKLPALRGSARSSFDFKIALKNKSAEDTLVTLTAAAPEGFETLFKEGYGSQELTSLPVKAGESKDITMTVKPPQDIKAGQYRVVMQAASEGLSASTPLMLDITGQPKLALAGPEGRLSATATAGEERALSLTLRNDGSAPARDISLSATAPSGWKTDFQPAKLAGLDAGGTAEVSLRLTPSDKAIAGDYMVTVRASGQGASDDMDLRVTVETSTMWGIAGLGVIAASVVVLGVAVSRFGRR